MMDVGSVGTSIARTQNTLITVGRDRRRRVKLDTKGVDSQSRAQSDWYRYGSMTVMTNNALVAKTLWTIATWSTCTHQEWSCWARAVSIIGITLGHRLA